MTSRRIVTSVLLRSTTSTKPLTSLVFRPKGFPSFPHSTTLRRPVALHPLLQRRWHSVSSGDDFKVYGFSEVYVAKLKIANRSIADKIKLQVLAIVEDPEPKAILLDVREPHEYAEGCIPTALNMPITSNPDALFLSPEDFQDRFGWTKPGTNKQVVFYCKAGVRSSAAAQMARQSGYKDVVEYRGSWLDWVKHEGPTSKDPKDIHKGPPL